MDILGVGPLELIFILIIALIVLGPSDMVKAGKTIGRFLRQVVTSPTWHAVTRTSSELRNLPNKLIRDAGLEEDLKDIEKATRNALPPTMNNDLAKWQEDINNWTTPPTIHPPEERSEPSVEIPPRTGDIKASNGSPDDIQQEDKEAQDD
jgi:uncharacterized protein YjiS (DUF1127 family)